MTSHQEQTADLVLTNATILDPDGLRTDRDIAIMDGEIAEVDKLSTQRARETVDCRGLLIVPGFVNAHHHFATGLLRGAPPPKVAARNQRERLEQVVWPFERRLSVADVRAAVRASLVEAIAAGTTTAIDHHVSGGCIPGVLDVIAEDGSPDGPDEFGVDEFPPLGRTPVRIDMVHVSEALLDPPLRSKRADRGRPQLAKPPPELVVVGVLGCGRLEGQRVLGKGDAPPPIGCREPPLLRRLRLNRAARPNENTELSLLRELRVLAADLLLEAGNEAAVKDPENRWKANLPEHGLEGRMRESLMFDRR
mgnify:CR=1 FL=1